MSESKTSRLSADKLARLWDIGSEVPAAGTGGPEEQRAERLRDWLARSLPPDEDLRGLLSEGLGHLCRDLRPFSGDAIGLLITCPETDVVALRRIKHLAKERGTAAGNEMDRDVALAVYFAAIASALVFHDTKISQHGDRKLKTAFGSLGRQPWVPPDLAHLFEKARGDEEK